MNNDDYYDMKIFSTTVLTLNFDLDLSKVSEFDTTAERLAKFEISRKSDSYFSTDHNERNELADVTKLTISELTISLQ